MSSGKTDIMLIIMQDAFENHKKNMRNTFNQMREMEKQEKNINGEETAMFIYGDIIKDYIQEFEKEKEEREEEAKQLRILKDYLQEVSLEEGEDNKHLEEHSRREAEMIAKELGFVNAEIKEIGTLTSSKHCD
jgi:hypothetical protein